MTPMLDAGPSSGDPSLLCPECDYNLTGAPGPKCPWCGWEIDPQAVAAWVPGRSSRRRFGAVLACLLLACSISAATLSLAFAPRRQLTGLDWLVVLGAGLAVAGHLLLAIWSLRPAVHWPLRRTEATNHVRLMGWLSIVAAVAGATSMLGIAPTPRVVRGVMVNGVFEFLLASALFTLPGWTLLVMNMICFRPRSDQHSPGSTRRAAQVADGDVPAPFIVDVGMPYEGPQVQPSWRDESPDPPAALQAAIASVWETETALARAGDRVLYNGSLVRLSGVSATPAALHLEFGPTTYRDFLGTHVFNRSLIETLGAAHLANPLGVSATLITRDGHLAFGRRSDRVAHHGGYLHTFGGMIEQTDRAADGTVDVFAAMLREVWEELGVAPEEVAATTIVGLARDKTLLQPELLFDVCVLLTRRQLLDRFDPTRGECEHVGIETVPDEPEAMVPFLTNTPTLAPVVEAAVLLHGRHEWGYEWYEQACYLRYGEVP